MGHTRISGMKESRRSARQYIAGKEVSAISKFGDMFPGMKIRERYQNDNAFRVLVDTMQDCIEKGKYTPTEIREAAMLAQILYEERHPRPIVFSRQDVIDGNV